MLSEIERNPRANPIHVGMRKNSDRLFRCWVVSPDGRIKTVRFHLNVDSPIISVLKTSDAAGRLTGLGKISISKVYEDGWDLLFDLYKKENRMHDWEAFLEYEEAVLAQPVNQRMKRKDEFGDKVYELKLENRPPITDDLLPDEVLRRRKAATSGGGFKMPLSEKQKAEKKEKRA